VEKVIVKHADGIHSDGNTCRKNILRLLKDDLAKYYENNHVTRKKICSYYIKTIVLHLWEEEDLSWAQSDLLRRYVDALQRTVQCLNDKNIEHFFIEGENLLDEKEISDTELKTIKEYFDDKMRTYSL